MDTENTKKFARLVELSKGDYEAFLYDCDGTLADNMAMHQQTYVHVAQQYGAVIAPEIITELAGYPVVDVVHEINKRYNLTLNPEEFAAIRHRLFVDEYIPKVKPITFVVRHLQYHAKIMRIAVVSGGQRESVEKTLDVLGISPIVETIVCAGETDRGKPFPDPFLAAAKALGVPPEKCLVFEDGEPGVEAARLAGMHSIRIDRI